MREPRTTWPRAVLKYTSPPSRRDGLGARPLHRTAWPENRSSIARGRPRWTAKHSCCCQVCNSNTLVHLEPSAEVKAVPRHANRRDAPPVPINPSHQALTRASDRDGQRGQHHRILTVPIRIPLASSFRQRLFNIADVEGDCPQPKLHNRGQSCTTGVRPRSCNIAHWGSDPGSAILGGLTPVRQF